MSDSTFIRAFERGDIAPADFHHASHLRLAIAYLEECRTVDEATQRMASALRSFAAAAGKADKYHHTLTVFWMRMAARLLNKDLPLRYHSSAVLSSEDARTGWLEPDRRALEE
jgi:hypothetical protein